MAVQSGLCQTWSETPKTRFITTRLNSFKAVRVKFFVNLFWIFANKFIYCFSYHNKTCTATDAGASSLSVHLTTHSLLAHLSRRLIGELIVYPWSGVRRPSASVVRRLSTMLKHLLLRNRLADQSQILCGASLGRGNDILFAASGSRDQDGRHAHIW